MFQHHLLSPEGDAPAGPAPETDEGPLIAEASSSDKESQGQCADSDDAEEVDMESIGRTTEEMAAEAAAAAAARVRQKTVVDATTALKTAVKSCSVRDVVEAMEVLGPDAVRSVNLPEAGGRTLLHVCALRAADGCAAEIVRLLAASSARPDTCDREGQVPLSLAVSAALSAGQAAQAPALGTVRALLDARAEINTVLAAQESSPEPL